MNIKAQPNRRYDANNRQAQARATREAIIQAAIDRLRQVRPEELRFADLADDVGVATRTVYRHFPTMEALLAAALDLFLSDILDLSTLPDRNHGEIGDLIAQFHARITEDPGLYRLFFVLPARSGVGMSAVVKALCHDALTKIPAKHHESVCAAVELMLAPYAWEIFHVHWGVSPAKTTITVMASIQAILDRFSAKPELLDMSAERPPLFQDRAGNHSSIGPKRKQKQPHAKKEKK